MAHRAHAFRGDVEGLRGIAIVLVLLFHGTTLFPGGFIGVDVFFVISGFLITGMLLDELEATDHIDLLGFYDRRIRRLLPAATLLLLIVLPLSYLVLAPLDRPAAMFDGATASLFVSNLRFAMLQGDYFSVVSTPSPFIHFWSLSLEEQFYLVWPFLLLLVARGRRVRVAAGWALVVLLVVSFLAGVFLTDQAATWGFYSLPARAWQFAAGGLLAAMARPIARLASRPVAVVGWGGLALLVVSLVTTDGTSPYPGVAALLPTIGAVLLILSGQGAQGPGLLLRTVPLRFLGRISYSLYLWHWPLLVLPAALIGHPPDLPLAIVLMATAVVVAWASWKYVEERFRRVGRSRERYVRPSRRAIPLGGSAVVAVVAWATILGVAAGSWIWDPNPASAAGDGGVAGVTVSGVPTPPDDSGPVASSDATASPDVSQPPPSATPVPTATPAPTPAPVRWDAIPDIALPSGVALPSNVKPALSAARNDEERLMKDGCFSWLDGTKPATCVYGKASGTTTVVLVGDSHASHWFPALNALAIRHGWRLLPYAKATCPFMDLAVIQPVAKREYRECATWRAAAISAINAAHPALVVVVTAFEGLFPVDKSKANPQDEGAAMARSIAQLHAPVGLIIDNPRADYDIPACLSSHTGNINACAIPRSMSMPAQFAQVEEVAAKASGATLVDLIADICPSMPCPVVRNGMILFRDGHHLTATFVKSLADPLDAALAPIMATASTPVIPAVAGVGLPVLALLGDRKRLVRVIRCGRRRRRLLPLPLAPASPGRPRPA
jgi:peptidoglycan/LPS O-acetylase OafA/YrhL